MLGNDRSESSLHSEDDFSHRFSITLNFTLRSMSTINLDRIGHLLRGTNQFRDNLFGSSSVHSNAPVSLLASRVTSVRHSALRWQRDPLSPQRTASHRESNKRWRTACKKAGYPHPLAQPRGRSILRNSVESRPLKKGPALACLNNRLNRGRFRVEMWCARPDLNWRPPA